MPTASNGPHIDYMLRGIFRRQRFLSTWKGLVSTKLDRFRTASGVLKAWQNNDGNRRLVEISQYLLSRIDTHLAPVQALAAYLLEIGDTKKRRNQTSGVMDALIDNCGIAEDHLQHLESIWHPFLIARQEGDAKTYDPILSRLLRELAPHGVCTQILPIICHKLKIDSAATVVS